jgi:hypothetical protein
MNTFKNVLDCHDMGGLSKCIISSDALTTFGISGNYVCSIIDGNDHVFVKIALHGLNSFYQWKKPPSKLKVSSVEVEIDILRAIRKKIINCNLSPHYIEIIAVSTCTQVAKHIMDISSCNHQRAGRLPMISNNISSLMCGFQEIIRGKLALDRFSIIFSSYCAMTLRDFVLFHLPPTIAKQRYAINAIIFQIYYTLLVTQRIWPKFRHGDLLIHNIMMELDTITYSQHSEQYLEYIVDGRIWIIPYHGHIPKIIDFGHGQIPEENIYNALNVPGNKWVPDHIMFILSIIELVQSLPKPIYIQFDVFNPNKITLDARNVTLLEYASTIPTPEDILLNESVFNMFMPDQTIDRKYILHTYIAPPPKH